MSICVLMVSILPLSTILIFDIGTVPTERYFSFYNRWQQYPICPTHGQLLHTHLFVFVVFFHNKGLG